MTDKTNKTGKINGLNAERGFVKLPRSILEKGWYKDADKARVFIHLLLTVNWKPREEMFGGKNMLIPRGSRTAGRQQLSSETGISESKITRILEWMQKSEHLIEQQKSNRNRIITMTYYDEYCKSEQQNEQQVNNSRTTDEQQVNNSRTTDEHTLRIDKNGEEPKEAKEGEEGEGEKPEQHDGLDTSLLEWLDDK